MRYVRWVILCALAELFGIGAAAIWYGGVNVLFGEPGTILPRIGVWLLMTLAAVPEGVILGGLQAVGVRWYLPDVSSVRWIVATIAVGLLGWGIGTFIPLFIVAGNAGAAGDEPGLIATALYACLFGVVVGTLFGVVQAWALPAQTRPKGAWVIANAAGWALGLPAIYVSAQIGADYPDWSSRLALWSAGGLATGAAVGIATGIALMIMVSRPREIAQ